MSKNRKYRDHLVSKGSAFYNLLEELDSCKAQDRKELTKKIEAEYKRLDKQFHETFGTEVWSSVTSK